MRWFRKGSGLRASRGACALCALGLILLLFGDVIFLRASLAPIDYADALATTTAPRTTSWLPERTGRTILDGQGDLGAAAWQMEPAARFMAYCLRQAQSPYWDPYTATGSLGPETLVDVKFSPLVVVTALFGGGSKAFSFVLLTMLFCSAYCLLRACTAYLDLSMLAAFSAAAVFFLNGFALGNLYTQMGQPYFLAPVLLLALLIVTAQPGPGTFSLALGAQLLFFATTFFPTLVLVAIVVYGFVLTLRVSQQPRRWRSILVFHTILPLSAVMVLGFLYVPVFRAYLTFLDTVTQYRARITPGVSLVNLLSLFTPKHMWQSYRQLTLPGAPPFDSYTPWIHHLGIIAPLIAIHAFSGMSRRTIWPISFLGACFLTGFGQLFGIFPFTLLDSLPFFSFVSNGYWPAMFVFALVLLTAYGFDAIRSTQSLTLPCAALITIMIAAFITMHVHIVKLEGAAMPPHVNESSSITLDIDKPALHSTVLRGTTQFGGWAVSEKAAVSRVALAVDGHFIGDALYGTRRDDVCHIYQGRPGCPNVGWDIHVDTTQFANGKHTLSVTTYAGTTSVSQSRQLDIANPWAPSYVAVFWITLLIASLLLLGARNPQWTKHAKSAVLALLVVEGMFYMNNLRPYRSDRDEHLSPLIAWLDKQVHEQPGSRILDIGRSGVFPNWGSALQIPQLGNLNSGELPWYREFFHKYIGVGLFLSLDRPDCSFLFTDSSLSLAGVRYIIVDRPFTEALTRLSGLGYPVVQHDSIRVVFENPHSLPRSFVVHSWTKSDSLPIGSDAIGTTLSTTDQKFLSELNAIGAVNGAAVSAPENVEILSYRHGVIQLRCKLQKAGMLILTDSWDPDWTAEVNGKRAYIGRVDVAFRGIALSGGTNEVVLRYRPIALVVGETISLATVLTLGIFLLVWRRRKLADRKEACLSVR